MGQRREGRGVRQRRVAAAAVALLVGLALVVTSPARAQTYLVTSPSSAGPGSLREAILSANASPGQDTINFSLPGPGPTFNVDIGSVLPPITDPVVIDGRSQPGFVAGGPPVVTLRGLSDFLPFAGLFVQAGGAGSTIRDLAIVGFDDAVALEATSGVTVSGNLLGLLPAGTPAGNVTGIRLSSGATANTVVANTISGNTDAGVAIDQSTGNRVVSNRIGTNPAGTAAVPNAGAGIEIQGPLAGNNTIGEAGAGNLISGNGGAGVMTEDASTGPATANLIAGNLIGTDVTGTAAIGNAIGLDLLGSVEVVAGNVISGNPGGGLHAGLFGLAGFVVRGNRVGTNSAGTGVVANGLNGISLSGGSDHVVGGAGAGEGNVVSGNVRGIDIDNVAGARIEGNLVGTDATGTAALGNSNGGIQVADGLRYEVVGNTISGNTGPGVIVYCLEGDPQPTSAVLSGNRIGTNLAGAAALPNTADGVVVVACAIRVDVDGNLISGNAGRGIFNDANGATLVGNLIGTDASGTAPLGNGSHGIELDGSANEVGAGAAGGANTIAFNAGAGVLVSGGTGNDVRANSIHDNGGLGIDLAGGAAGVTSNDAGDVDEGPNRLQNFPVLTSAVAGAGGNTVAGTLASLPNTVFALDLHANAACDPSGAGEGQTVLTSTSVTTNAAGAATFSVTTPVAGGQFITATATDPAGNTSEFSACAALAPPPGISITDVSAGEASGAASVTVAIPAPSGQNVSVTVTTANGTATAPADYTATSTTVVIPAGSLSTTVAIPLVNDTLDEADETFTVTLSNPVGGVLGVPQRTVTIVDDDPLPALRIADAVVSEGNAGTSMLTFTVSLSAVSGRAVTVNAVTSDGTATAGTDYTSVSTTLTIPAGFSGTTLAVPIVGDVTAEPDETFTVTLSGPVGAVLADATAVGVIATDDGAPPVVVDTTTTTSTTTTTTAPATDPSTSTTTSTTRPETKIISITDPTTTTTAPPAVNVTTTVTAPPPVSTVPTTTVPATTTSSSSSSTTSTSSTTPTSTSTPTTAPAVTTPGTTAPSTSTTVPASASRSTLTATAPDGSDGGPPGVGLDVAGAGYLDCDMVYFFFDGVRVGSGRPDAAGEVRARGLSVPGDASLGERRVTSACRSAGDPLRAQAPFTLAAAPVHRPAFLTAIPQPRQVSTGATDLATSGIVAALLLILLAFPSQLFNATFTENYDEIRGWFRMPRRVFDAVGKIHQSVAFATFAVVGGLIYSLLSPDFGFDRASLALLAGMTVAVAIVTVGFAIPSAVYMRRNYGEWGKIAVLPGSLLVGVVCVSLSRLLNFQPGYLYGVLAAVVFARTLREREQGRVSAVAAAFMLVVSVGAWALRVPVSAAAAEPGAGVWLVALESCLGAVFLLGLESVVVGLLPMRFLDGARVKEWSRVAWAILFFLGLFALIHVLLSPGSGYVGHTSGQVTVAVIVLYVIFGAISVAFWAYFRYRPERWIPRAAR